MSSVLPKCTPAHGIMQLPEIIDANSSENHAITNNNRANLPHNHATHKKTAFHHSQAGKLLSFFK